MTNENNFEVIIIGGSYAGLSAAMSLGRSLREVLIIDSGEPCNRQAPYSHNFITHDGDTPKEIAAKAKEQVLKYDTIKFYHGLAMEGIKTKSGFEIKTEKGSLFAAKKLLFATGITDLFSIKGLAECWGISVLHCPYCHGYEVRHENTGVVGNGDIGFEFVRLINNWTKQLTLFTNGRSTLTTAQTEKLKYHNINIIENEIFEVEHSTGHVQNIVFKDKTKFNVKILFTKPAFKQHCDIPQKLGCETTEQGHINVDDLHRTSIHGVYAAGDNSSFFRSVAVAVASGNKAGALINKDLIEEEF